MSAAWTPCAASPFARRRLEEARIAERDAADRNHLPDADYAFSKERKEPLEDARHVLNAVARLDPVKGVSDAERGRTWKRIEAAAERF